MSRALLETSAFAFPSQACQACLRARAAARWNGRPRAQKRKGAPVSKTFDPDVEAQFSDADVETATGKRWSIITPQQERMVHQPGTVLGCAALVAGTTIGAGVLALPAATQVRAAALAAALQPL